MLAAGAALRGAARVREIAGGLAVTTTVRLCSTGKLVENSVTVTALGSLYKDWAKLKPHLPRVPVQDINLDLHYTRLQSNPKPPSITAKGSAAPLRIVAFHGAPGSAADFNTLAEALGHKASIDFVAPTFPDLASTLKRRQFWQSAEEKFVVTEALLEKIGINEIDVALGHSAGSYSAIMMCLYAKKVKAKSLVIISSTGFRMIPVLQPERIMSILMRMLWIRPLDKFVFALVNLSIKLQKVGKMTAYEAISSAASQYSTIFWGQDRGLRWCRDLETNRVPRMAVLGMKDKLVPPKYNKRVAEDIGNADERTHAIYEGKSDEDLKLVNKGSPSDLPEIVVFREGGHFVFQQYPDVIAQHIIDFAHETKKVLRKP